MRGDEGVSQFRDGREARQFSVEREPDSLAARVAQGQEAGLGGARALSVGRDVLHGALKVGERDRGILRRHFLIRPVIDSVAGELLPIARPVAAEPAIAVIDQSWPRTGARIDTVAEEFPDVSCMTLIYNEAEGDSMKHANRMAPVLCLAGLSTATGAFAQAPSEMARATEADHQQMMNQLGITDCARVPAAMRRRPTMPTTTKRWPIRIQTIRIRCA